MGLGLPAWQLQMLLVQFEIDLVDYERRREGEGRCCSSELAIRTVVVVAVEDLPRR